MKSITIFNPSKGFQVWIKNDNNWRYIKRTNVRETWRSRVKLSDKLKGARS
jgi:hypothetical protein